MKIIKDRTQLVIKIKEGNINTYKGKYNELRQWVYKKRNEQLNNQHISIIAQLYNNRIL